MKGGKSVIKENPKSELDLDLGFVDRNLKKVEHTYARLYAAHFDNFI